MRAALERAGVSGEALDLYIFGNVLNAGHGQSLPRQAAFKTGIPQKVNGYAAIVRASRGIGRIRKKGVAKSELCYWADNQGFFPSQ